MTRQNRTIALVPVAALLLLGSCGGGGESSKKTVSPSGATGPAGSNSASREPYRTSPTAPKPARGPGAKKTQPKRGAEARQKQAGSSPAAPSPTTGPQEVLARKAKRICESLGIDALAAKYNVEATPEAVATAYAASYPPTFRAAVHGGCRSAFSRR